MSGILGSLQGAETVASGLESVVFCLRRTKANIVNSHSENRGRGSSDRFLVIVGKNNLVSFHVSSLYIRNLLWTVLLLQEREGSARTVSTKAELF